MQCLHSRSCKECAPGTLVVVPSSVIFFFAFFFLSSERFSRLYIMAVESIQIRSGMEVAAVKDGFFYTL